MIFVRTLRGSYEFVSCPFPALPRTARVRSAEMPFRNSVIDQLFLCALAPSRLAL